MGRWRISLTLQRTRVVLSFLKPLQFVVPNSFEQRFYEGYICVAPGYCPGFSSQTRLDRLVVQRTRRAERGQATAGHPTDLMELVRFALKFRKSFYVLAVLMFLTGLGSIAVAPKDVLPAVDIPMVIVVWTYNGLDATDMVQRITNYSEFSLSSNVNNIRPVSYTHLTLPTKA